MRQRLAAVTLLSGLTALGLGLAAGPASAKVLDCDGPGGYLRQTPNGSLQMTSAPAPDSDVPVGSDVALEATWDDTLWNETDRFYVCTTVDGVFDPDLSSQNLGVHNNGIYAASGSIPASVPAGSEVCFTGALRGRLEATQTRGDVVSETLCFRVAAVATTTTTMAPTTTTTTSMPDPVVEDEVIEAGGPAAPAVEVAPAVEPAPLPELPRTGAGIGLLAGFGGISLALGGLTRLLGRRRNG